jgi:hypothetical protein
MAQFYEPFIEIYDKEDDNPFLSLTVDTETCIYTYRRITTAGFDHQQYKIQNVPSYELPRPSKFTESSNVIMVLVEDYIPIRIFFFDKRYDFFKIYKKYNLEPCVMRLKYKLLKRMKDSGKDISCLPDKENIGIAIFYSGEWMMGDLISGKKNNTSDLFNFHKRERILQSLRDVKILPEKEPQDVYEEDRDVEILKKELTDLEEEEAELRRLEEEEEEEEELIRLEEEEEKPHYFLSLSQSKTLKRSRSPTRSQSKTLKQSRSPTRRRSERLKQSRSPTRRRSERLKRSRSPTRRRSERLSGRRGGSRRRR